jgi:hypothetical protein
MAACFVLLLLGAFGSSAQEVASRQAQTRFGVLSVETDAVDRTLHRLVLGRRTVMEFQGSGLAIAAVIPALSRDLALIEQQSAGLTCPTRYVILEIASRRQPVRSEVFGSCAAMQSASLHRETLLIQIPAYAANPAALTEEALRRLRNTIEVYSWSDGTLNRAVMRND